MLVLASELIRQLHRTIPTAMELSSVADSLICLPSIIRTVGSNVTIVPFFPNSH